MIVLCNRTGEDLPAVAAKAVSLVFGPMPLPPEPAGDRTLTPDDRRRLVGTFSNGSTTIVIRERAGQLVGARGGVWTKVGENRFLRSAFGDTPAAEFLLTGGLGGRGTYLVRNDRALRKVD